jgi:ABC-type sulfate transport system permease component
LAKLTLSQRQVLSRVPGRRLRDFWWPLSLPLLAFLALPLIALLARSSLGQLWLNLNQPVVYQAISLSLFTSTMATAVTIVLGTPLAFLMARRQFRLKRVVDTLIDLPTVLPPAVAGVALLMAFGRRGIAGSLLAELGIHIFAGNFPGRTQTMPLAIYIGFELDLDVALTLSVILMGLSFLTLMLVKVLFQRE